MEIERLVLNEERNVTLTAYIPDISEEMPNMKIKPAVLVFPGGAYKFCSDREAEPVAFEFMAKGYNVFILRYSLNEYSVFPTPLNDAVQALTLIREKSAEWCTDPAKIAVCGFSAGGHLAAAVSTMSDVKPNACILGYPCILQDIGEVLANPVPSLNEFVTDKTPPTFIVSATDDGLVPIKHSIEYAKALGENGVSYEMHIFSRGGHGFSTSTSVVSSGEHLEFVKNTKIWMEMCLVWLEDVFKD